MDTTRKAKIVEDILKKSFEFKAKSQLNGILLNLHHTESFEGPAKRIPFRCFAFNEPVHHFFAIDVHGNAFVFDFTAMRFWNFDTIAVNCCCIAFDPFNETHVIIGTKSGLLQTLDLATGHVFDKFQALIDRIQGISIAPNFRPQSIILCYSSMEAILYTGSLEDGTLYAIQLLTIASIKPNNTNLAIKKASFILLAEHVLNIAILLNDDSLYIYQNSLTDVHLMNSPKKVVDSFELSKHINLIDRRDLFVTKNANAIAIPIANDPVKGHLGHQTGSNNNDGCTTELIADIAFTSGHASESEMAMSCADSFITMIETKQWTVTQNVMTDSLVIVSLREIENVFPSKILNRPIQRLWSAVTKSNELMFIEQRTLGLTSDENCVEFRPVKLPKFVAIKQQEVTSDGKMLALSYRDGTIVIYRMDFLLRDALLPKKREEDKIDSECVKFEKIMKTFDQQLSNVLPCQRLLNILKEYGEYPAQFRPIIWKILLQLPSNSNAYTKLLTKGLNACVKDYDHEFPLRDAAMLRNLKKIASSLAYWCPILAIPFHSCARFLPNFIFPFVKMSVNNSLMGFEMIATIMLNQCQLWFEFSPMEPVNYLGLIENMLSYFEPSLIAFYRNHSITNQVYGWQVSRTAFSEVLDESQWYQLWDHIVSGPSYFFLFVVVAFNSIQRSIIERLSNAKQIKLFFHEPSNIDINAWLKKAYWFMINCPDQLHPNQYMSEFEALSVNSNYRRFQNYPRQTVDEQALLANKMAMETKIINRKYTELEKLELELVRRLTDDLRLDEHRRRIQKIELAKQESLVRELERIERQRMHLNLYERQIYDYEVALMMDQQDNQILNSIDKKEHHLQTILNEMERNKIQNENELLGAEQTLRKREMDLLVKHRNHKTQNQIEVDVKTQGRENNNSRLMRKIEIEKTKLKTTIDEIKKMSDSTLIHPKLTKKNSGSTSQSIETLERVTDNLEQAVKNIISSNLQP